MGAASQRLAFYQERLLCLAHSAGSGPAATRGYMCFWIINVYIVVNMGFATMYPRMRRLSVERKWNSFSDILSDRFASRAVFYFAMPFPICGLVCYVIAQLWAFHELMP